MSPQLNAQALLPRSVSGVRPFLAFAVISCLLLAVIVQLARLGQAKPALARALETSQGGYKEAPRYTLLDRNGRELAVSVKRYALELSPFNLWMRHTPERIRDVFARVLDDIERAEAELDAVVARGESSSQALGRSTPEQLDQLMRRSFGADENGRIAVTRWPLLYDEAVAIEAWVQDGGPALRAGRGRLPGIAIKTCRPDDSQRQLLRGTRGPYFVLQWEPEVLLSAVTRERARPGISKQRGSASRWVQHLGRALFEQLEGPRERELALSHARWEQRGSDPDQLPRYYSTAVAALGEPDAIERMTERVRSTLTGATASEFDPDAWIFTGTRREWVFDGLLPSRYVSLIDPLPAHEVAELRELLASEELGVFEVWLQATNERHYPAGEVDAVGRWGWIATADGEVHAPLEGLECLAAEGLERLEHELAATGDDESARRLREGSADELSVKLLYAHGSKPRAYFLEDRAAVAPSKVVTTIDLDLSKFVAARLERLVTEKQAALAMAVAIDVDTREVLALEWADPYGCVPFAPLQHLFTPGSTFKTVTMSLALEEGVVTPDDMFDVGTVGSYVVSENPDGTGRKRRIGEAEGFLRGVNSAAECLAHSSNAGLVQIGLRIPAELWKSRPQMLGYALPALPDLLAPGMYNPKGGVGEARSDGREWNRTRSHASVSFGDSVSTNLLQHATAFTALIGGGEWRPLQLLRSASFDAERYRFVEPAGRRVVSSATSASLRAMLQLGAEEGTGRDLQRPDGLLLHSKTGTTEKLPFDVCQHEFGSAFRDAREAAELTGELEWDGAAARRELMGKWGQGRGACYVSSIATFARSPRTGREVLVMVVVDDPHGPGKHFGSKVAGPAAIDILYEALELPSEAEDVDARQRLAGFAELEHDFAHDQRAYRPWAQRVEPSRGALR